MDFRRGRAWVGCLLALSLAVPAAGAADAGRAPRPASRSPARWGVEPVAVSPAQGGRLLYFRYRVLDAGKAKALFDRKVKPYVVDHSTGSRLAMPELGKVGALRSSPKAAPVKGKSYYVLFDNYAEAVKPGSKVDVVMGDCRFRDLVVE